MAGLMSREYEIGRSAGVCSATGRRLEPGEHFVAALVEGEEGDTLERLDYSVDAWGSGQPPARLFAHWRSVVPEPDAKPKPIVDQQTVRDLFEQLAEARDAKRLAFRYVLALLMMRKRELAFVGQGEHEGRPAMFVRIRGSEPDDPGEPVIDPGLDDETIAAATEQLRAVLRLDR